MSGYIEGISRDQVTLFPDRLEDWIDEDHPVRVIDAFVDAMDLAEAGFARMSPAQTGRHSTMEIETPGHSCDDEAKVIGHEVGSTPSAAG
jgi:transposase